MIDWLIGIGAVAILAGTIVHFVKAAKSKESSCGSCGGCGSKEDCHKE